MKKLRKIVNENLYLPKKEIAKKFGKANERLDECIWFFEEYRYCGAIKNEIGFIFEEDIVVDIFLTQYLLGREFKNIFYYEGNIPEYKCLNVFFFSNKI